MWKNFLENQYDPAKNKTKLVQFRNYIQLELEERLTNLPDLGYEDEAPDHIYISLCTFAFDNSELINLLKQRGAAIKFEKWDLMREINGKIDHLKSVKLESFNRPVTAFLTFENEEGLNRMKSYNDTVFADDQYEEYRILLGEELDYGDAPEPTDIIWENRHFTSFDRFKRLLIVIAYAALILIISFVIIFFCSQLANKPLLKYPPINCQDMEES